MSNRDADLETLRRDYKIAGPDDRRAIDNAARRIQSESGEIRDMRESLIKEHRQGNVANIKDINEIVAKKAKYRTEYHSK